MRETGIQTFPDWFSFRSKVTTENLRKLSAGTRKLGMQYLLLGKASAKSVKAFYRLKALPRLTKFKKSSQLTFSLFY